MQWVSRGSSCALSTDLLYRIVHPDVRKSLIQPNIPLRAEWLCHAGVSALVADNPHNPTGTVRDRSGHTQNPTAFNEATNFLRSGCTKVSNMLVDSAVGSQSTQLSHKRDCIPSLCSMSMRNCHRVSDTAIQRTFFNPVF